MKFTGLLTVLLPEYLAISIVVLLIIAFIWWKFRHALQFLFRKKKIQGTIVNWMAARVGNKEYFYPMIEFTTESGQRKTFRAEERSEDKPMFPIGTTVTIWYLPGHEDVRKVVYPG
ncbi:MAG: hypothetical protein JNM00_13255 [Flavobacteriales bacterium]|nr:hypothetical protein [Flavobacteriales bacterium]